MGRLANKIALVTGGASVPGLGSASAIRFAEEGATVFVTDVDAAGAEAVAHTIRDKGGMAKAIAHDVTSEADWDRVVAAIIEAHGRLDILVNNAGIAVLRMIETMTSAEWRHQLDVNLNSVFFGTQRAVREMRRVGQGGSIINISSGAGIAGVQGAGAYSASKAGVRLFSKSIALECARDNIRVNSVHPGAITTNINAVVMSENPELMKKMMDATPMGRFGVPDDIANMNLFLASDESKFVTGAEFVADGGFLAG